MKKILAMLIALLALFSLTAACGSDDEDDAADETSTEVEDEATDDAAEDEATETEALSGDEYIAAVNDICTAYSQNRPQITGDSDFAAAAEEQLAANTEAYEAASALEPPEEMAEVHEVVLDHYDPERPELVAFLEAMEAGDTEAIQETADASQMSDEDATTLTEAGVTCG